ncbi:T9SS type A sorting domain-containing protein [Hymenobacter terricola]|uniref:T9SS type A sorting domain-containing protein n=1 Tax=Hymenobacter terricola TaxID=2819236 RepID=UPI001B315118|nr:T9SS type A sorting domain-containing protein [Hymenobacter terricola]
MTQSSKILELPKVALALLLVCGAAAPHTSQGQGLYNGAGGLVAITDSVRYVRGDVENAGELDLTTAAGSLSNRLFIDEGNLLNTATGKWVASKSTVVLMGMAPHLLSMNGASLYTLRLDNPAGTTLGSDATVAASLRLAAGNLLTTPAYSLHLGPDATVRGAGPAGAEDGSHYVQGSLVQAKAVHGTEAVSFGNMGVVLNPNGQSLTVTVDRRSGLHQVNYSYGQSPEFAGRHGIDRIWQLSTAAGQKPTGNVAISLAWLAANDYGLDFGSNLAQVWQSTTQGQSWTKVGEPQSAGGRAVTVATTELNAWYTVSLSSTKATGPLAQTLFAGTARRADAVLTWSTATKPGNGWYVIERSVDQQQWREISRQPIADQRWSPAASTAVDKDAGDLASTLYYRLRQLDINGNSQFSKVITMAFTGPAVFKLEAYPVPLQEYLTLDLVTTETGLVQIELYDIAGRLMISRKETVSAGASRFQLDVRDLASGVYSLRARQGDRYFTRMLKRD